MTMLDRMRRHKAWLQWSLVLVVLAFIIFYIPDFLRGSGPDAAAGDTIASVEGRTITSGEFRRTYQAQLQAYRSAYGGNMSNRMKKATRANARYAVIVGDNELASGKLGFKDLDSGAQSTLTEAELFSKI